LGELRRGFEALDPGPRRFLVFLFFNVISWQCLVGPVLVLHARAAGIDRATVGMLNSLLFFAGVLGLATRPLAERFGSKRVLKTGWVLRNLLVLPMALTPWVYARGGPAAAAALLFVATGLFCVTRSMAGIAWSSWLHEIVPPLHLARFYASEVVITRLLAVSFGVLAFFVLGHDPPLSRFAALTLLGVSAGLFSIRFLRRVPGGGPVTGRAAGGPAGWRGLRRVLSEREFTGFLGCAAVQSAVSGAQGLTVPLLLRDNLGLGPGLILLLTTAGNVLTVVTVFRWRRVSDALGSPLAMATAGLLSAGCLCGLACLASGPGRAPLGLLAGVCALMPVAETGLYVATSRGYMLRMQAWQRHATNAVWSAALAVTGGTSSVAAGLWLHQGAHDLAVVLALAALAATGAMLCLRQPESSGGHAAPGWRLTTAGRILRIGIYVLRPGRTGAAVPSA
jgi:hypothetical protein